MITWQEPVYTKTVNGNEITTKGLPYRVYCQILSAVESEGNMAGVETFIDKGLSYLEVGGKALTRADADQMSNDTIAKLFGFAMDPAKKDGGKPAVPFTGA